jgi:hypothetical protein
MTEEKKQLGETSTSSKNPPLARSQKGLSAIVQVKEVRLDPASRIIHPLLM